MLRRIACLMIVGLSALAMVSGGNAQEKKNAPEKNPKSLQELIAKFPVADKNGADVVVAELLKDPEGAITGLVDVLSAKWTDYKARLVLHTVVIRVGGEKDPAVRQKAAQSLASTLTTDRPKEVQGFVVRQLQFIGDEKQAAAIGKLLLDAELGENAAQALLAIKSGAADQFRAALPQATAGKQRARIVHGLGTLKDKKSADSLLKFLGDEDRDTRLNAAWALANLPEAAASERLLKLADAAKGYERDNATVSCFLLAENLLATGNKAGARQIYAHLNETRTDAGERFVKDAAAKGLEATK